MFLHATDDGQRYLVRPIAPSDKPLLVDGLKRLSPETVYRRFLGPKPSFSGSELRYLTEVDGRDHVAYVVVPLDPGPRRVVAVGRYVRLRGRPDTAEFAIVVADPLQGRGLGSLLARTLSRAARANGIRTLSATILEENVPVRRLIARIARELREEHRGPTAELVGELLAA